MSSNARSCSAMTTDELLVTKSTRHPAARIRATASGEPGIASLESQTTPSRSQSTVDAFVPAAIGVVAVMGVIVARAALTGANLWGCRASSPSPP